MSRSSSIGIATALAFWGVLSATAMAATFRVSTSSGRPVMVSNEAAWDHSCASLGNPAYSFTQPPVHGTISTQPKGKIIQTCDAGNCQCKGKPIAGLAVIYTPERGFHGVEQFTYSSTFPNGVVLSHQGIVTVR